MLLIESKSKTPFYCVIMDNPTQLAVRERVPLIGWERDQLNDMLNRAGIHHTDVLFISAHEKDSLDVIRKLREHPSIKVIFPMGNFPIQLITGKLGQDKWNLSPLDTLPAFPCRKAVPTFSMARFRQDPGLSLLMVRAFMRGTEGFRYPGQWKRKEQKFLLNPTLEQTLDVLLKLRRVDKIAVDIETGRGQINTVGFAWSAQHAIAINVLPDRFSDEAHLRVWQSIARLLEGPAKKIYQNFIYEAQWFSRYGIRVQNTYHDTMWAQKVLYPEFGMGLDNVGRFYTNEVYWKDDGKNVGAEGKKKDWGNIRDWDKHYSYNAKDTTGTFEAQANQEKELHERGLAPYFYDYTMKLAPAIQEMCSRGLPVSEEIRAALHHDLSSRLSLSSSSLSLPINLNSSKEKMALLRDKGYKIPKVRNKEGNGFRESADAISLKKMRLKYPEDADIEIMLSYAKDKKALSSYVDISYHSDGRLRYSINGTGTETLRFSSSKDAWGLGLNAQTLPKQFRKMFVAPPGKLWMQVDLKQAESRYVAYDSCDENLIRMLETGQDIHRYVAAEIFGVAEEDVTHGQRQLGKKSGHGANYSMGANTFMDSCLKEMDLVLTKAQAQNALDAYHRRFPKIRLWHNSIKQLLFRNRKLTNPLGAERYFYGRMDDNTFREAFAYKPQSTIPAITNKLMLSLLDQRDKGNFFFELCLQVHDSLIMLTEPQDLGKLVSHCRDTSLWHPEIILPAGKLVIPVDCETGSNLGELKGVGM